MDWRFVERDDQSVAQALVNGEGIDAIYSLNDVGLLTGFFAFLQAGGILNHWHSFEIKAIERASVPTLTLLLLYGVRLLCGIGSNNALPALLFSNLGVMSLIGVTAWQVGHGFTRRGEQRRSADSNYALMDPQTLAGAISKAGADELARLFNGTIHCLAAYGLFAAEVLVAIDGTPIVTTALYAGCGLQRKRVKRRTKAGVEIKSVEVLYGWRLIVLVDLLTLIPLAVKVVPIQQHEAPFLLELVEQAQRNLAPYSRIRWLVADRAYVAGQWSPPVRPE